jgi:hypothetical protein
MVVLTKKGIEPHDILIDTNILHNKDKAYVVTPEFDQFWEKHSSEFSLSLKIPDVVVGELLFQQTSSALKTLSRANGAIDRLSGLTNKTYSHRITEKRVRDEISDRMDCWIKSVKGEILATPIQDIDWNKIIHNSIWRQPPFSHDEKNDDLEKGFRDNLILETVYHHAVKTPNSTIFICNDNLLKESLEKKIYKNENINIKIHSSLNETDAYLKLRRENYTEKFVNSIINKASLKFINKKDPNCIVRKENLREKLFALIDDITSSPYSVDSDNNDFEPEDEWKPITKGKLARFGKSQFSFLENGHTFNWIEDVRFKQVFEVTNFQDETVNATLLVDIEVKWKCNVSEAGRFTKVEYCTSNVKESRIEYSEN